MSGRKLTEAVFRKLIVDKLPETFARKDVPRLLDGLIAVRTLSNLEARDGRPKSFLAGTKAYYTKDEFVAWAREHYHVERDGPEDIGTGVQAGEGTPAEAGQGFEGAEGGQGE